MESSLPHNKRFSLNTASNLPKGILAKFLTGLILCILLSVSACNKFVEVPSPTNKITTPELFKEDANATSAVLGIYSEISAMGLNVINGAMTVYPGLASDELNYTGSEAGIAEYQNNTISTGNYLNQTFIWSMAYGFIYQTNACIEGITASNGLSTTISNQLLGECKVIRGLLYFYLIQTYGDVPLITKTDYNTTSSQGRNSSQEIYNLIIKDLTDAQKLLTESYPSDGRLRCNKHSAEALLARIYLFRGNWEMAEAEANNVINASDYSLETDLNKVFLANSKEAIWQLSAVAGGINTREGATFVTYSPLAMPGYIISNQLMDAFEPNDPRKIVWVGTRIINSKKYYFPYKYKVTISPNPVITENYVILRLAEQYLIRAEARIRQGKIEEGLNDLNTLRNRASGNNSSILPELPAGSSQDQALSFVLQERRIELMTEWGNRWFDLKRFHLCGTTLKPIKASWQDADTLFPIPYQEILLNKNLIQNNGYN